MKGQPHFVESPEPIPAGRDYNALCGRMLSKAYFCFTWDIAAWNGKDHFPTNEMKLVCGKCLAALWKEGSTRRYIYGAVPGDEVKKREGQDDAE